MKQNYKLHVLQIAKHLKFTILAWMFAMFFFPQKLDPFLGELFTTEDWKNMRLVYQELIKAGLLQQYNDDDEL